MDLRIELGINSYDIHINRGAIKDIANLLDLNRKIAIISDDLIPEEYVSVVKGQCKNPVVIRFPHGEKNKNLDTYKCIIDELIKNNFDRHDAIIALGGGVSSDLAGYVAATYMRGIDFYIIPTTLLSQVDASIGGKVAINFGGYKNLVGSFYQPKKVIIDPDTLNTLSDRLFHEGLVEAIKMAATMDKDLFAFIENSGDIKKDIEEIIYRSLLLKKKVVEQDEKEMGLRKVLNFGHTFGHAIESAANGKYYHGECVGLGMLYCSNKETYKRIENLLKKYDLPYDINEFSKPELLEIIKHDKKAHGDKVTIVKCDEIGSFRFEEMDI